ncbi:hypothetical protein AC1031_013036 [Aphanomyces cochlioides]|nr:hypothetical protein AC1031_013036 [Aphanomyces cochlioides]
MSRSTALAKCLEPLLLRSTVAVPPHAKSKADYVHELVHSYYLPVFFWAERQLQASSCIVLGLSCVQGGGKTTMTSFLETLFHETGKSCASLSLDDVYLTRSEQVAVAQLNAGNPLLEHRGNPGTQDLNLLLSLIQDAKAGRDVLVPRYNKSAFDGRGDRFPRDQWIAHKGPLDVLLVEGWCLGFEASPTDLDGHLKPVNAALRDFDQLYAELSALIVVQVDDLGWVYTWREQAEARMREEGKPAMTPEQVKDFVDRFMPAYERYLPQLYSDSAGSSSISRIPRLTVTIGQHRECTSVVAREGRNA